jgi:hypothetical protein
MPVPITQSERPMMNKRLTRARIAQLVAGHYDEDPNATEFLVQLLKQQPEVFVRALCAEKARHAAWLANAVANVRKQISGLSDFGIVERIAATLENTRRGSTSPKYYRVRFNHEYWFIQAPILNEARRRVGTDPVLQAHPRMLARDIREPVLRFVWSYDKGRGEMMLRLWPHPMRWVRRKHPYRRRESIRVYEPALADPDTIADLDLEIEGAESAFAEDANRGD